MLRLPISPSVICVDTYICAYISYIHELVDREQLYRSELWNEEVNMELLP